MAAMTGIVAPALRFERLRQVFDEVLRMFEPDRNAQKVLGGAAARTFARCTMFVMPNNFPLKIRYVRMPVRPMIEPTEMSMPPVAITKVMPTPRISVGVTCTSRSVMAITELNCLVKIRLKRMSTISAISAP